MSKKFKILILIICILIISALIIGISTIIKFNRLNKIYSKTDERIQFDNYYLKITFKNKEETKVTESFYKDGTGTLVAENGVYTWTNGEQAYMVDDENKNIYVLDINNDSKELVSHEMFASLIPGYNKSFFQRLFFFGKLNNTVTREKKDDVDCYLIKTKENNIEKSVWLNKITKKPIAAKLIFKNGDVYEYKYDLIFNVVTTQNIQLPDIKEYKINNNKE